MKVFSAGGPVGTFAAIRRFAKIGGQIERKALLSVLFSAGAASVTLLMVCDERVGWRNRILPQEKLSLLPQFSSGRFPRQQRPSRRGFTQGLRGRLQKLNYYSGLKGATAGLSAISPGPPRLAWPSSSCGGGMRGGGLDGKRAAVPL